MRESLGGTEIRLSLRTAYVREAKPLADRLHDALRTYLQGQQMLTFQEIKKRLAALVVDLAEFQAAKFETMANDPVYREPYEALSAKELRDKQKALYQDKRLQEAMYEDWVADKLYNRLTGSIDTEKYNEILDKPFKSKYFFALYTERHAAFLMNHGFFSKEEIEENKAVIGKALMQACLMFNDYVVADEDGNTIEAQKILADYVATATLPHTPAAAQNPPSVSNKLFYSEAVDKYIAAKLQENAWKTRNVPDIRTRLLNFVDIKGDMPIEDISRQDMRSFMEILQKLPPHRNKLKIYAGKSIPEVLAMNPERTLNVATINSVLEAVGSLLEWYVREGVLNRNPAKGLQVKDTRQAIDLREAFSRHDLERIFAHPKFAQSKFKYPAYFWIPLIALFTGMRLEEIAQLFCADIYQDKESSLWVIDVTDVGQDELGLGKSLKNKHAHRRIPIHQALVDLGLVEYRTHVAKAKHTRLFPELKSTAKTPKLGKQPGKQFSAVVNEALSNSEKKSFHSLRHTFADFYKQKGLQTDYFRQLYGHDIPELATKQYGSRFPMKLQYTEVIEKLDYDLNLSHLASPYTRPAGMKKDKLGVRK
jgi:integrase